MHIKGGTYNGMRQFPRGYPTSNMALQRVSLRGPNDKEHFQNKLRAISATICNLEMQLDGLILLERLQDQQAKKKRKLKPRRWYTRRWIQQREQYGQYDNFLQEVRLNDREAYRYFLRVDPEMFDEMLERITPLIMKKDTNFRDALRPGLKLAITLRFMATGETYKSLATAFRVASNTISLFVPEVCEAIIQEYMHEWLVCPTTEEDWKKVADGFSTKWNFHNAIGALDGKHVAIVPPANAGSYYHNYKGYHSIVLLALVDWLGRFMYIDVGANGSCSDGGIFQETELRHALESETAGIPEPEPLPGEIHPVPYFIVADNAFPMRTWLQKPHPQRGLDSAKRNYNYRLSRARRIVENAFGMWANKFRLFLSVINVRPPTVEKLVIASCIIHNMMRTKTPSSYPMADPDPDSPPGNWLRDPLDGLEPRPRQAGPGPAKEIREYLTEYYNRPENRISLHH